MGLALLFASVCLLLVKATRRYYKLHYLWRTTLGRLLTATNPEQSGPINYTYDDNGNLSTKADARSVVSTLTYDSLNRLSTKTYNDGTTMRVYCYDGSIVNGSSCIPWTIPFSIGRQTSNSHIQGVRHLGAFDPLGRIASDSQHTITGTGFHGYTFDYAYNRDGSLQSQTYPSGTVVNYTYDAHGRAYGANTPSGPSYVNSTNYNAAGQIADRQLGNLLTEQNCFNDRFQPTVKRLGSGTSTNCANQAADSLHLAFDYGAMTQNNGNLKQQTITADPTHQWVQYYEYDEVNRLSIAAENAPLPANCTGFTGSWCREFDYDHFGNKATGSNRVMHQAKPVMLSQTNIATNRLTTATYDDAGNMTSHPVITPGGTISYDANNKKWSFTKTGLNVTTYYDANDRRVREVKVKGAVTTETIWVYDAFGALVAEYSDATPTVADGVYYRTTDHLGSTRIVTDDTATVLTRRDYFPFGEEVPVDSNHGDREEKLDGGFATYNASSGVNQKFTGQERDDETGLDYFRARNYAPCMALFMSPDPANAGAKLRNPQSWNAYVYVENRPMSLVDNGGKCSGPPPNSPGCQEPTVQDDNLDYDPVCASAWSAWRSAYRLWEERSDCDRTVEDDDEGDGVKSTSAHNQRLDRLQNTFRAVGKTQFGEDCKKALSAAGVVNFELFSAAINSINVQDARKSTGDVGGVIDQSAWGSAVRESIEAGESGPVGTSISAGTAQQNEPGTVATITIPLVGVFVNPTVVRVDGPNTGINVWDTRSDRGLMGWALHEALHFSLNPSKVDIHKNLNNFFNIQGNDRNATEGITNSLTDLCF